MGRYVGIPLLLVAALLNATVMVELRVGNGAPDLVLLLVVSWALLADVQEALFWAVVGGVMQDLFSVAPLGASALGLVVVAFAADAAFGDVRRTNMLVPPVVAVAGTVVYHLGLIVVLRLAGYAVPLGEALAYVTLPAMIYNGLLILPVFRAMGLLHTWLSPRQVRLE